MASRWIGSFIGAIVGIVFGPPVVISFQDAMGHEVDPILGGILPALIAGPVMAVVGYYCVPTDKSR